VRLRHRFLGAVEAVENQFAEETEANLAADVEVSFALIVDDVDVVASLIAGDVEYLRSSI
jgi:hypothetical protein